MRSTQHQRPYHLILLNDDIYQLKIIILYYAGALLRPANISNWDKNLRLTEAEVVEEKRAFLKIQAKESQMMIRMD